MSQIAHQYHRNQENARKRPATSTVNKLVHILNPEPKSNYYISSKKRKAASPMKVRDSKESTEWVRRSKKNSLDGIEII